MQSRFRRSANVKAADWRLSKVLSQLKLLVTKHLLILAEEGDSQRKGGWGAAGQWAPYSFKYKYNSNIISITITNRNVE